MDAQKQFSRLYESVGKINALKWRIKNGEAGLQQEYKQARKKLNRSLTGITMSALIVAMVNKFMRWLLGREDKDNFWEGLGSDMIGQFFGLLPIVRDFYGYLADDYEINNYALGMINDSADAIKGIWTVSEKLISGQYVAEHEINKPVRNLLYTFGQFTGIPFRNMYNLYYGVLDKFSPSEALKLKSLFYGNSGYSAALKDAVDKGDLRNADKIVALMLEDKTGKVRDDNVIETTRYLVSQGYNPMPKSLNKKITYNSEEINLTARQHAEFSKIYEQSNDVIKSMVNSSRFERLDDSAKARAMKMVYDYYYNLGLENLIGESLDNKTMLFASGISIDQLAMAVAQAQTYEAKVNKLGNVISGSKKHKIQQFINGLRLTAAQKYMIMGYLGYSNKNGGGIVKAYINRLQLSKSEKETLYTMSGYLD